MCDNPLNPEVVDKNVRKTFCLSPNICFRSCRSQAEFDFLSVMYIMYIVVHKDAVAALCILVVGDI